MLRRSMTVHVFIFILTVVIVPLAFAQRSGSPSGQRGSSKPTPPQFVLPDLTITSATAKAQCVNGTVTATIVATVKNGDVNGIAGLSKVPWAIVMGATWGATHGEGKLEPTSVKIVKPQLGGPKTLKPGESWKGTMTFTGIPRYKPGTAYAPAYGTPGYSFTVTADPLNAVTEVDEKNNTRVANTSDPCYVK